MSPGKKIIGSGWVFMRKADGNFKARIGAQGWKAASGVDSSVPFSPTCRLLIIWTVLSNKAENICEVL